MSFNVPRVALQDPISGNLAQINASGELVVNPTTINVTATSVQLTSSSVTVSAGSVNVIGSSISIIGAVSNASVAGTTAYVSVKAAAGRYYGMTVANTSPGAITVTDGSGGIVIGAYTSGNTSSGMFQHTAAAGVPFSTALVVLGTASSPPSIIHFA